MYLNKTTYVRNSEWMKPGERHEIMVTLGGKTTFIKSERITYIVEQVAKWRKANAIHRWFVENVQDGEDDCREYDVSEAQLRTLLTACTQVLETSQLGSGIVVKGYRYENGMEILITENGKRLQDETTAKKLLPTQAGLFFGSTDYDHWYIEYIQYTKDMLQDLLAEEPADNYCYSSSW